MEQIQDDLRRKPVKPTLQVQNYKILITSFTLHHGKCKTALFITESDWNCSGEISVQQYVDSMFFVLFDVLLDLYSKKGRAG